MTTKPERRKKRNLANRPSLIIKTRDHGNASMLKKRQISEPHLVYVLKIRKYMFVHNHPNLKFVTDKTFILAFISVLYLTIIFRTVLI